MKSILFFIAFAIGIICLAQPSNYTFAEFQSKGDGNWSSLSTWEVRYDGGVWQDAQEIPGASGHPRVSVLIRCGDIISFNTSVTYTLERLTLEGIMMLTSNNITVKFETDSNFTLDIHGGTIIWVHKNGAFQIPENAILIINEYDEENETCPGNGNHPLAFEHQNGCNASTVFRFGDPPKNKGGKGNEYYCNGEKTPTVFDLINNKGSAIGSIPTANPAIICNYDGYTIPQIIANYMNYEGDDSITYKLTLESAPTSVFKSNFSNKIGKLQKNKKPIVIDLVKPLDVPGDYKFKLEVTLDTNASVTNVGFVTIKRGESVEFVGINPSSDTGWEDDRVPTLYNGLTAVINANYDTGTYGSFSACSCEVKPGKTLTIGENDYVELLDRIKVEGTGTVIVENDGNLIQTYDTAVNDGNIEVRKTFNFSAERKQYNYVSIPVVDASKDVKSTIYSPNPTSVQQYNTGTDYFDETNGLYISGIGYAVKESPGSPDFAQFTGTPFNGVLPYTLKTNGNRYNLVGNPYPSNIDINMLYKDNEDNIGNSFYFWDNRNNGIFNQQGSGYSGVSYAIYDALTGTGVPASTGENQEIRIPSQFVKVGTGFIIQAETSALNFKNSQRTINNTGPSFFGKGAAGNSTDVKDRYWLTMITPGGIQVTNAVVYFEGGNDSYWKDDTNSFLGADDLFTIVEGNRLAIQGKSVFSDEDVITLGYKAFKEGTHIISVFETDGVFADGQQIYLIDKLLNRIVNLSEKPYKFLSRAGEFNDRFEIVYKPTQSSVSEPTDIVKNLINYSKVDNRIQITSSLNRISEVEVFDLSGRPLYKKSNIQSKEFNFNIKRFDRQIIIVTVKTENGEYSTRKFVN